MADLMCNDALTHGFSSLFFRPHFFQQGRAALQHILQARCMVRALFPSSFPQIFFQKHQLNARNAIEHRRDDPNFRIAMLLVHRTRHRIPGVRINA